MRQRVALQVIKAAQNPKKSASNFENAAATMTCAGALGGFAIGMWNGGMMSYPHSTGERLVDKSVSGVVGIVAGGAAGFIGTYTAPLWVPIFGTAYLIDRYQMRGEKR